MLRYLPENKGFKTDLIVQPNETLRVGIIDADLLDHGTRHPNLALLKVSAFCKEHGHLVRLITSYDELMGNGNPIITDCDHQCPLKNSGDVCKLLKYRVLEQKIGGDDLN